MSIEQVSKEVFEKHNNVLLCGPGGTGKSYMLNIIASDAKRRGLKVYNTATTGIASINLIKGKTFHSYAGIGTAWQDKERLYRKVKSDSKNVKRITETNLLIIDEISMFGAKLLEKVDFVFRKITNIDKPFGGIQVIFGGDFMQLPPVKDEWIFTNEIWEEFNFVPIILNKGWRYDDIEYFNLMMRIRIGTFTSSDVFLLKSRVKAYDVLEKSITESRKNKKIDVIIPTVLYSRKKDVLWHNNTEMEELTTEKVEYNAVDDFTSLSGKSVKHDYYIDLLNEIIPQKIELKIGAQVMLKVNLDPGCGLVSGSRGVVIEHDDNVITVKFRKSQKTIRIQRYSWVLEDDEVYIVRTQFPLILAWALTIHKGQGSTLDYAVCDLGPSIFSPGQAYVALSRVRNIECLYIIEFSERSIKVDKEALEFCKKLQID
mgnify:CR=1 FL=1